MREKKLYWDIHPDGSMTRKLIKDWNEEERALYEREQAFVREARALGYVFRLDVDTQKWTAPYEDRKAFEALVRADEREACAKVCDDRAFQFHSESPFFVEMHGLADAIRARGETK
jgi:hypothetical protein